MWAARTATVGSSGTPCSLAYSTSRQVRRKSLESRGNGSTRSPEDAIGAGSSSKRVPIRPGSSRS